MAAPRLPVEEQPWDAEDPLPEVGLWEAEASDVPEVVFRGEGPDADLVWRRRVPGALDREGKVEEAGQSLVLWLQQGEVVGEGALRSLPQTESLREEDEPCRVRKAQRL